MAVSNRTLAPARDKWPANLVITVLCWKRTRWYIIIYSRAETWTAEWTWELGAEAGKECAVRIRVSVSLSICLCPQLNCGLGRLGLKHRREASSLSLNVQKRSQIGTTSSLFRAYEGVCKRSIAVRATVGLHWALACTGRSKVTLESVFSFPPLCRIRDWAQLLLHKPVCPLGSLTSPMTGCAYSLPLAVKFHSSWARSPVFMCCKIWIQLWIYQVFLSMVISKSLLYCVFSL